jgi:proteasome lid subunit RPN8/RPN11
VNAEAKQPRNHEKTAADASNSAGTNFQVPSDQISGSLLHGSAPREQQVTVVLKQSALRQLEGHAYQVLDAELGGVLLGKVERQDVMNFVLVKEILPVHSDDYGPVHFKFSADSWAILHKEKAERYPNLDIVGWYHTHPGLGIFYSSDDVIVHSAAFVLPWHVGLVIDPVHREGCFFGWQNPPTEQGESTLKPLAGYYELQDEQKGSVVTWQLAEATVWKSGSFYPPGTAVSDQVFVPANEWPSLPPINPWWGVLLGGTSLILTLLILLDRILGLIG